MPLKDPEKRKAYKKAYYEANKEKIAEYNKDYYEAHRDKIIEAAKTYHRANVTNLPPCYIASRFRLSVKDVPPEVIELKRLSIQLKRELRNGLNQNC